MKLGHLVGEVDRAPLGLHGDQAEICLDGLVDRPLKVVVAVAAADVAEVELEHHLIDPAALDRRLEDLGQQGVMAAQAAETRLALFLERLERRLHMRDREELDLVAGKAVEVVAVDVVGLEPLEAGV